MLSEGVTLSGVRKDEDCKPTELWRIPFIWVPKVQSVYTLISQAKGQSHFPLFKLSFCGLCICHNPYFSFGGSLWKHFLIRLQVLTM